MNTNRKKQAGLLLIVVVMVALLAAVMGGEAAQANEIVVSPSDPRYEELSVEWYEWALALPDNGKHPYNGNGKVDCSLEQDGEVWFLAGTNNGWPEGEITYKRTCEEPIPEEKYLFFPIVNIICSPLTGDDPDYLVECAGWVLANFIPTNDLFVKIDGVPIVDLENYAVVSEEFDIDPLPKPNILDARKGAVGPAVTSGYYLLLEPLPEGEHNIEFKGRILAPDYGIDWTLEVEYEFTVDSGD